MHFSLLIIGIIIAGLMTLVTLIFTIISLAGGKGKNAGAWGAGFIVSLAILIFCVIGMVQKMTSKIQSGVEWLEEHKNTTANDWTVEGEFKKGDRQEWLDTLQLHINEMYEGKVPVDFYINQKVTPDSNNSITVPFLYPYMFRYNSSTLTGDLVSDLSDSTFVQNVSQIAFDQNFAIIKVDNSLSPELLKANHAEVEYLLFDMRSRNFESAANMEKLIDLANRIGYTGPEGMTYLYDDYKGWIDYQDYD